MILLVLSYKVLKVRCTCIFEQFQYLFVNDVFFKIFLPIRTIFRHENLYENSYEIFHVYLYYKIHIQLCK